MIRVLFVGALPYGQRRLAEMGYELTLLTVKPELYFGNEGILEAQESLVFPGWDAKSMLDTVKQVHFYRPFDGVISFDDAGLRIAAQLALDLGIPGNELVPVLRTTNKYALRQTLDGTPWNVEYHLCNSLDDARVFFDKYPKGIVLKPLSGHGSRGVMFVNDTELLAKAYTYTSHASGGPVLAEQYVKGREFSVETFTHNSIHQILAITDKDNTGPPHFVGTLHCMPSSAPDDVQAKAADAVRATLDAVGVTFGPAHTEIAIVNDQAKIIEIQLRPGGRFYHMLEGALGYDIFAMTVASMFGIEQKKLRGHGAACIYYLRTAPGVVVNIEGIAEVEANAHVRHLFVRPKVGDTVHRWKTSLDRSGHIICVADTPQEARTLAITLGGQVKIVTRN